MPQTPESLREKMLQEQLIRRGIYEERLLSVFRKVPRHLFLPPRLQGQAYEDRPLEIGFDQTISQPYMVALMSQAARWRMFAKPGTASSPLSPTPQPEVLP